MKKASYTKALVLTLSLIVILSAPVFAGHADKAKPIKKGILLVAFGSSIPEAKASFQNIESNVKKAFPELSI